MFQKICKHPAAVSAFQVRPDELNSRTLETMPSVFIKTYGCQMNERDSEAVAAQLVAKGYTLAGSEATADVILLNTCSVRDLAEQKALRKMENVPPETPPQPARCCARISGLHGAEPGQGTHRPAAGRGPRRR